MQLLTTEAPADNFVLVLFKFTIKNSMVLIDQELWEKAGQEGAHMRNDVMKW